MSNTELMQANLEDNLSGPKEKVVIFAEGNANDVYWEDGYPVPKQKDPDHFANAARDFAKGNPQYEYHIIVGKYEDQIHKGFQDMKDSGFMDDNTRLIVMGHASSEGDFGSEKPEVWQKIMRDTGLRGDPETGNGFSEVGYGACRQGEMGVCVDLSRAFGNNTTVYAQVGGGQSWGAGATPNIYLDKLEAKGGHSELHERPKTFQDAFRTVGSGLVTYKGGQQPAFTPGSTVTTDPYGSGDESDAYLDEFRDPEEWDVYQQAVADLREANPYPVRPERSDYYDVRKTRNRAERIADSEYILQMRFLKEKWEEEGRDPESLGKLRPHEVREDTRFSQDEKNILPFSRDGEYLLSSEVLSEQNRAGHAMDFSELLTGENRAYLDSMFKGENDLLYYDFLDWMSENPVNLTEEQLRNVNMGGGGNIARPTEDPNVFEVDLLELTGNRLRRSESMYATYPEDRTSDWRAGLEEYHGAMETYNIETSQANAARERGLAELEGTLPEWQKQNPLLDSDKVIDFPTIENMVNDPEGVVSLFVNDENRMGERIEGFKELWMGGNDAAQKALEVAYNNLNKQNVINEIDDKAQWDRAIDLEALRIYSESDEPDFIGWDKLLGDY